MHAHLHCDHSHIPKVLLPRGGSTHVHVRSAEWVYFVRVTSFTADGNTKYTCVNISAVTTSMPGYLIPKRQGLRRSGARYDRRYLYDRVKALLVGLFTSCASSLRSIEACYLGET